mgnify:CR=1 FL=1
MMNIYFANEQLVNVYNVFVFHFQAINLSCKPPTNFPKVSVVMAILVVENDHKAHAEQVLLSLITNCWIRQFSQSVDR